MPQRHSPLVINSYHFNILLGRNLINLIISRGAQGRYRLKGEVNEPGDVTWDSSVQPRNAEGTIRSGRDHVLFWKVVMQPHAAAGVDFVVAQGGKRDWKEFETLKWYSSTPYAALRRRDRETGRLAILQFLGAWEGVGRQRGVGGTHVASASIYAKVGSDVMRGGQSPSPSAAWLCEPSRLHLISIISRTRGTRSDRLVRCDEWMKGEQARDCVTACRVLMCRHPHRTVARRVPSRRYTACVNAVG